MIFAPMKPRKSNIPMLLALGVLYAKGVLDEKRHRITLQLPCTKASVVQVLLDLLGGSTSKKYTKTAEAVCYVIRSKKDFARLSTIVGRYARFFPALSSLELPEMKEAQRKRARPPTTGETTPQPQIRAPRRKPVKSGGARGGPVYIDRAAT